MKTSTLFIYLCFALLFCIALAEEVKDEKLAKQEEKLAADPDEPDTAGEEPVPEPEPTLSGFFASPDVSSSFYFPKNTENKFAVGSWSDVLLGFENTGDKPFKIQYIRGHIVSPMDWTYLLQNFTGFAYNVTVEPDESNTLLYRFRPDKNVDLREFGIVIDVFYTNPDNDTFATTFFNQTVTFVEAEEVFDPRQIGSYIALAVIMSVVGYILLIMFRTSTLSKKFGKSKKVEAVAQEESSEVNEDWIPDHVKKTIKVDDKKTQ
eukprot:gene8800-748_t